MTNGIQGNGGGGRRQEALRCERQHRGGGRPRPPPPERTKSLHHTKHIQEIAPKHTQESRVGKICGFFFAFRNILFDPPSACIEAGSTTPPSPPIKPQSGFFVRPFLSCFPRKLSRGAFRPKLSGDNFPPFGGGSDSFGNSRDSLFHGARDCGAFDGGHTGFLLPDQPPRGVPSLFDFYHAKRRGVHFARISNGMSETPFIIPPRSFEGFQPTEVVICFPP